MYFVYYLMLCTITRQVQDDEPIITIKEHLGKGKFGSLYHSCVLILVIAFLSLAASDIREKFVTNLPSMNTGKLFDIRRSNLYDDVISLFQSENILDYYPLRISFVDERAIDCGGVCRDMISGFWEEAYHRHFDGSSLLAPVIHAQSNMSAFVILGTILSHGYLLEGYLPVRIAFPSLATMLLGQIDIPDKILVSSFADSLSSVECQLVKTCLTCNSSTFSVGVQSKLINLLSRFGSRHLPTPLSLHQQIVQVAKFEFLTKPIAAHIAIHSGISELERAFWNPISLEDLHSLYICLTATPDRVLDLMEDPECVNPAQERIYGYLEILLGTSLSMTLANS